MNEKIVIKYLDKLVNKYVKDTSNEFMVIDFIKTDEEHIAERKDQAESYKLADEIESFGIKKNLFKVIEGRILVLDEKGIELKDFGKGYLKFEKHLNAKPLDWYRVVPIILTIVFGLLTFYFAYHNYELKLQENLVPSLIRENDSLNIELNRLKNKPTENKIESLSDTLKTKNLNDLSTE